MLFKLLSLFFFLPKNLRCDCRFIPAIRELSFKALKGFDSSVHTGKDGNPERSESAACWVEMKFRAISHLALRTLKPICRDGETELQP